MSDINPKDNPAPKLGEVRPGAVVIEGVAHNGRPCRLIDNTGSIAPSELQPVLDALIADRRFGISGRSAQGGSAIPIAQATGTHIQFGERLYRILLFPYEARIEDF